MHSRLGSRFRRRLIEVHPGQRPREQIIGRVVLPRRLALWAVCRRSTKSRHGGGSWQGRQLLEFCAEADRQWGQRRDSVLSRVLASRGVGCGRSGAGCASTSTSSCSCWGRRDRHVLLNLHLTFPKSRTRGRPKGLRRADDRGRKDFADALEVSEDGVCSGEVWKMRVFRRQRRQLARAFLLGCLFDLRRVRHTRVDTSLERPTLTSSASLHHAASPGWSSRPST